MTLTDYIASIDDFYNSDTKDQMDYLSFYLVYHASVESFTAADITALCTILNLHPHNRLAQYLSEESKSRTGKYIKRSKGYQLNAPFRSMLEQQIAKAPILVALDQELERQITLVADVYERDLLEEAARCYKVKSYRAAVVMVWAVTVSHLHAYVFNNKLVEFNAAVVASGDKRLKPAKKIEDLSEMDESRFIQLLRNANLISKDIRKILDEKLGIRNSAAHPSKMNLKASKAIEFGHDLLDNVILKF